MGMTGLRKRGKAGGANTKTTEELVTDASNLSVYYEGEEDLKFELKSKKSKGKPINHLITMRLTHNIVYVTKIDGNPLGRNQVTGKFIGLVQDWEKELMDKYGLKQHNIGNHK